MSTKVKVIIAVAVVAAAFAVGRYTVPEKVRVETKVVEVIKKVKDTSIDQTQKKDKRTTTTTIVRPDGTKETTTVVEEITHTDKKTDIVENEEKDKQADSKTEVVKASSRLNISALGGVDFLHGPITPVFGAAITKDIIGPVSLGAFGLTNGTAGVSLGLSF